MADPTGWRRAKIRDVTRRGATWNPAHQPRGTIRYVDVSAVSRATLTIVGVSELPGENTPSRARKIVRAGDTIVATIRPRLRRIAKVPDELDGEIASTAFCVLRPNPAFVVPEFLFYSVIRDTFVESLASVETGASYPAVRDNDVLDQELAVPPFREQELISTALRTLRNALAREFEIASTCNRLKRAAMRELFTRGLRGEALKETQYGLVPQSWAIAPLDICAKIQTGVAKGRKLTNAETTEVPYLRVANVQDGHLDLEEMKTIRIRRHELERYRLSNGDIVLTEGGDFDKLGRGFIWRGQLDPCVHQNHVFAIRPDPNRLKPEFLAYLTQSTYGKAYFLQVAHKTTNLACINTTKLRAFPVLVPALDEQREITSILDALDRKIDLHKRRVVLLNELFKALLHKLMTGEIRVVDLDLAALKSAPAAKVVA